MRLSITDFSPPVQAQIRAQLAATPHPRTVAICAPEDTPKPPGRIRQSRAGLNKTETAFKDYLERGPDPARVLIQAVTLRLANGCRYTPDFVTITQAPVDSFDGAAFTIRAYEVKGFMRDDAAVKLKVAASAYPWISFFLVSRGPQRCGWTIDPVFP